MSYDGGREQGVATRCTPLFVQPLSNTCSEETDGSTAQGFFLASFPLAPLPSSFTLSKEGPSYTLDRRASLHSHWEIDSLFLSRPISPLSRFHVKTRIEFICQTLVPPIDHPRSPPRSASLLATTHSRISFF